MERILLMHVDELRREIQIAVDQFDRGEGVDEESLFNELDAEIDRIESSNSV